MPHIIIHCWGMYGIEKGPTIVGDVQFMDAEIEQLLGITRKKNIFGP